MSDLQKYQPHEIVRANNAVKLTNKLLSISNQQLIPYRKGNKWGFCTPNKNIVIECVYEEVTLFYEDIAAVKLNNKWGFINKQGKIILSLEYDDLEFDDGLFKVSLNTKWGIIDKKGKVLAPIIYEGIYFHGDGDNSIVLRINEKWNHVDRKLKPISLDKPSVLHEDKLHPKKNNNNKYGLIDKNGNVIIPFIYDHVSYGCGNNFAVKINNLWGMIDNNGKTVIPFLYDSRQIVHISLIYSLMLGCNLNPFLLGKRMGFTNFSGDIVIPCIYDLYTFEEVEGWIWDNEDEETRRFKELYYYDNPVIGNFILIRKSGQRGIIDRLGNTIIPCKYDEVKLYSTNKGFRYNIVRICLNNKEGYVGLDGTEYWED